MKYWRADPASRIRPRPAVPADAPAIGAVFNAAVRAGWTYLGELVAEPLFTSGDWDQLVADHLAPNVLLVAVDETEGVVGYTAAHPADCEVFLLFVHPAYAGRGIGRSLLTAAHDAPRAAGCTEACAHLLLQIRTRVLNDELAEDFRRWYPAFVDAAASAEPELAA